MCMESSWARSGGVLVNVHRTRSSEARLLQTLGEQLDEKKNVQMQLSFTEEGARYCACHLTPRASLRLVMEADAPNAASQPAPFPPELKPPDTQSYGGGRRGGGQRYGCWEDGSAHFVNIIIFLIPGASPRSPLVGGGLWRSPCLVWPSSVWAPCRLEGGVPCSVPPSAHNTLTLHTCSTRLLQGLDSIWHLRAPYPGPGTQQVLNKCMMHVWRRERVNERMPVPTQAEQTISCFWSHSFLHYKMAPNVTQMPPLPGRLPWCPPCPQFNELFPSL